jgi:hypothetical protein
MTVYWFVTGAALVAAVLAWGQARRTARRLEHLSQMYWELKFQHGELRVQLERLTSGGSAPVPPPTATPTATGQSFIPLTSLKR